MINAELLSYIKSEREKGTSDEAIRANLLSQGWTLGDIEEAYAAFNPKPAQQENMSSKNSKTVSPELKRYRIKLRHIVFAILMAIALVVYATVFAWQNTGRDAGGILLTYVITVVISGYLSSMIVTYSSKPPAPGKSDFWPVVGLAVGAAAIGFILCGPIFFVTCLFMASTGLLRFDI